MLPQDPSWRRRVFALMDRRIGIFIRQGGGGAGKCICVAKEELRTTKVHLSVTAFIRLEAPSDELVKRCQQESYYCETDLLKGKKPIRPTSFFGREGRACTSMNGWEGPNCPMTLPWLKMISLTVSQSTTRRFQEEIAEGALWLCATNDGSGHSMSRSCSRQEKVEESSPKPCGWWFPIKRLKKCLPWALVNRPYRSKSVPHTSSFRPEYFDPRGISWPCWSSHQTQPNVLARVSFHVFRDWQSKTAWPVPTHGMA